MTSRLTVKINRISYLGPDKPAAAVGFEAGLNVVCGSSETGKSFIVETIDFMLGGQSELRDLPERVGYDRIVMWITFSTNNSQSGARWKAADIVGARAITTTFPTKMKR